MRVPRHGIKNPLVTRKYHIRKLIVAVRACFGFTYRYPISSVLIGIIVARYRCLQCSMQNRNFYREPCQDARHALSASVDKYALEFAYRLNKVS